MKSLILCVLLAVSSSVSANPIASPQELLTRAAKDASALHESILDLQDNLVGFSTKDSFRSYFDILPELQVLAQELGLESIHPGVVKTLGEQMVAYGIRWLNLSLDDRATVQKHLVWINANTAAQYVSLVADQLFHATTYDAKAFSSNLDLLIEVSHARFRNEPYIEQGYRDINSEIAYLQLKKLSLTSPETLFWVAKLGNQDTLSGYISVLLQETYSLETTERQNLTSILDLLNVLGNILKVGEIPTSVRIYDSLGDVLVELLDRSALYSWPLDQAKIADLMPVLNVTQASNLGERIALSMYSSHPRMNSQNALIAESIIAQLSMQGATQKAQDFADMYYSSAPFQIHSLQKNEGIYVVRGTNGEVTWVAHFFRSASEQFILSLDRRHARPSIHAFFSMSYEYETDTFLFSQTSRNEGQDSGLFVRARFEKDGTLHLEVPDQASGWLLLTAKRESDPAAIEVPANDDSSLHVARFLKGKLVGDKGRTQDVTISILETNGSYLAQISIGRRYVSSFEGFFNYADGSIYLTSQQNRDGKVVRIKIRQDASGQWTGTVLQTDSTKVYPLHLQSAESL